jgi:hypothetical protein
LADVTSLVYCQVSKLSKIKLKLVNKHIEEQNLAHFPSCKSIFKTSGEKRFAWPKEKFSEIIHLLKMNSNQI